jgi:hypothetical protein
MNRTCICRKERDLVTIEMPMSSGSCTWDGRWETRNSIGTFVFRKEHLLYRGRDDWRSAAEDYGDGGGTGHAGQEWAMCHAEDVVMT